MDYIRKNKNKNKNKFYLQWGINQTNNNQLKAIVPHKYIKHSTVQTLKLIYKGIKDINKTYFSIRIDILSMSKIRHILSNEKVKIG